MHPIDYTLVPYVADKIQINYSDMQSNFHNNNTIDDNLSLRTFTLMLFIIISPTARAFII